MSQRPEPDIRHTAQEKVLIKHQAIKASRYHKVLIAQARKKAVEHCLQAQKEAEEIQRVAYQQGYQDGLRTLLTDLIKGLESSQHQYQQAVARTEAQVQALLGEIFCDPRISEIVCEYFLRLNPQTLPINMYLPPSLVKRMKLTPEQMQHVTIISGTEGSIALEVNNEILHFSPAGALHRTLPRILSLSSQCKILQTRKDLYHKYTEQFGLPGELYDNTNASLPAENDDIKFAV